MSINDSSTLDCVTTQRQFSVAPGIQFPFIGFQISLIFIGALGLFLNGIVLGILLSNEARRRTTNLLIINQLSLDMFSCLFLIISNAIQTLGEGKPVNGAWGLMKCYLFLSYTTPFIGQIGSIASLVIITLEKYAKIVHALVHRKWFRKWMVYVGIAASWLNGILTNVSVFGTTKVIAGICYPYWFWPSKEGQVSTCCIITSRSFYYKLNYKKTIFNNILFGCDLIKY